MSNNVGELSCKEVQHYTWETEKNLHYKHGECEAVDFIEYVLVNLKGCDNEELWHIGNALKYALRAGHKGDWVDDARKCADYINRFKTGEW